MTGNKVPFLLRAILTVISLMLMTGCTFPLKEFNLQKAIPASDVQGDADPRMEEIDLALQAVVDSRQDVLVFQLYQMIIDRVDFSEDGNFALIWLAMQDQQTNQVIAAEPFLAIAFRNIEEDGKASGWEITLPTDPSWNELLGSVPGDLLGEEMDQYYINKVQAQQKAQAFSGYRLPWKAGQKKYLTGSIGHVLIYRSCPDTCLYSFDFADGSMFPVLAARAGRVKLAVWKWPNGDSQHANFLLLQDDSTTPVTYQIYFHLAQDSIPVEFRNVGAQVFQGELIGLADDTGNSTGNHLHFQVHTNASSYWGTSVDILFDEVETNGGRPRTCYEASAYPGYGSQCMPSSLYISDNIDDQPPTSGITFPVNGDHITSSILKVKGWAQDNHEVLYSQLLIGDGEQWKPIGDLQKNPEFTQEFDLCESGIPRGDIYLSVQAVDQAGNINQGLQGTIHLINNANCGDEPPSCLSAEDQAAIYAEQEYAGSCQLLDIGDHPELGASGEPPMDQIASLKIGSGVVLALFDDPWYEGFKEIFQQSDPDLSNNSIGVNQSASIQVRQRQAVPSAPVLDIPAAEDGSPINEGESVTLTWSGENGLEFRSELIGADGFNASIDWQESNIWETGQLPADEYTWAVWSRNFVGENSATLQFDVLPASIAVKTRMKELQPLYYSTAVPLEWEVLNGEDQIEYFEIEYMQDGTAWQHIEEPFSGEQRSSVFQGTPGSSYSFRLQTIDKSNHYEDITEDHIRDTRIAPACDPDSYEAKSGGDNLPQAANTLEFGEIQNHNICGLNDEDWYKFNATQGINYKLYAEPDQPSTAIQMQLFRSPGSNLLLEGRSESAGNPVTLGWTAENNEELFLLVRSMDPATYGTDVAYKISMDRKIESSPPPFLCSGIILPLGWGLKRLVRQLKARMTK